jgi:hypothetical protein
VQYVSGRLTGGRNGPIAGKTLNIAVTNVECRKHPNQKWQKSDNAFLTFTF